jgi:leucyl aminopeptidase
MNIKKINTAPDKPNMVLIARKESNIDTYFSKKEAKYINSRIELGDDLIEINRYNSLAYVAIPKEDIDNYMVLESARKLGFKLFNVISNHGVEEIDVVDLDDPQLTLAFAEGLALSTYKFDRYHTRDDDNKKPQLSTIAIYGKKITKRSVDELKYIVESVFMTRDLVNEPVSVMNASRLSKEIKKMCTDAKIKVNILEKKKIQSLGMGGLLAVNQGQCGPSDVLDHGMEA